MILLATAFACLVMEATGSKIGEHKTGSRYYVILTAISGIALSTYTLPLNLITSSCLLLTLMALGLAHSQLAHSRLELGESYALILVLGEILLRLTNTKEWLEFAVLTALANILLVSMASFRRNRRLAAEIGLKFLIVSLFVFCLVSIGITLSIGGNWRLSGVFYWVCLFLYFGATPFFNAHVDYLEAAPGFAGTLLVGTTLIGSSSMIAVLIAHKIDPNLLQVLYVVSVASLLVPLILAFDQQRIARLVSYIIVSQAGFMLLLCLTKTSHISVFYLHLALAVPGVLAGVRFWKHSQNSDKNWEDYAGTGRKHPYIGTAWIYMLSSLVGSPFTPGFWIYLELGRAAERTGQSWIFALIIAGIKLGMFPIARLAVFMFGKPTHHEMMRLHQPRQAFLIILCALACAVSYGILTFSPNLSQMLK